MVNIKKKKYTNLRDICVVVFYSKVCLFAVRHLAQRINKCAIIWWRTISVFLVFNATADWRRLFRTGKKCRTESVFPVVLVLTTLAVFAPSRRKNANAYLNLGMVNRNVLSADNCTSWLWISTGNFTTARVFSSNGPVFSSFF